MMFRRFPLTLAALGVSAGLACWLTLGSFDLVVRSAPAAGAAPDAVRVAMLPPLWHLPLIIVALWALLAVLFQLFTRRARTADVVAGTNVTSGDASTDTSRQPEARALDALLPLGATMVFVLPFLPWLPDAVPVLRLLGGPARPLIWFVILAQVGRLAWNLAPAASVASPEPASATRPSRRGPLAIALVTFMCCGGAAAIFTRTTLFPGGDEPHYLVMAQSLWRDGDLRIENNHQRGDYREYFLSELAPHYLTRGADKQIYSVHPIGMPVLMAPVYALGGYRLVAWTMVLFATGAATLLWLLLRRLAGSASVATVAWAACSLTGPFIFNSFAVYPEIPAALATMIAFTLALPVRGLSWSTDARAGEETSDPDWRRLALCGLAASALPWFSTKYAPLSAAVIAIAFFRLWLPWPAARSASAAAPPLSEPASQSSPSPRGEGAGGERSSPRPEVLRGAATAIRARIVATLALGLPYAISLAAWFTYFYVTWGTWSPSAPYGTQRGAGLRFLPAGGPGLLFDQEYGVMAFAPALLLALTGLAAMLRRGGAPRRIAIEVIVAFSALLGTVGAFHIWWGGSATVGRPVMSGFLLLGLPIAWRYQDRFARAGSRALAHVAIAVGLAVALVFAFANEGFLLVAGRDGSSTILEWLSPAWSAWSLAPSFIMQTPAAAALLSAIWLLAFAALGWWLARRRAGASDRADAPGRAALAAIAGSVLLITVVSLIVPALSRTLGSAAIAATPQVVPMQARSRLLDDYDASQRPLAIVFDPFRRIDPAAVPSLVQFTVRPEDRWPRQPVPLLYNARFALPAGRYTVTLLFPRAVDGAALNGSLALRVGRVGDPAQTWDLSLNPPGAWGRSFDLPIDANLVGFIASPDVAQAAPSLRLTADAVVDHHRRLPGDQTLAAAAIGTTRVYFHDERVWLAGNGFWTPGVEAMDVTLAPPAGRRAAIVRLTAGPVPTTVSVRAGSREERIDLAPHAARELSVANEARDEGPIRLRVQSGSGFVPARREPGNPDDRHLGVLVELVDPQPSH